MDNPSHIKRFFDDLMDSRDIMMCQIYNERTGSILFKVRFKAENSDHSGGGTQNSSIYFKRKSNKQLQRDTTRAQDRNQMDNIASRTRSHVESVRHDISPSVDCMNAASHMDLSKVASPVICSNSPESSIQYCVPTDSPESAMHMHVNTSCEEDQPADQEPHREESIPSELLASEEINLDVTLPNVIGAESDIFASSSLVELDNADECLSVCSHSSTKDYASEMPEILSDSHTQSTVDVEQSRLLLRQQIRDAIHESVHESVYKSVNKSIDKAFRKETRSLFKDKKKKRNANNDT